MSAVPKLQWAVIGRLKTVSAVGVMLLMSVAGLTASPDPVQPGWGIDACLTAHVEPADRAAYLELLARSGVRVLRERGVQAPADGATPAESLAGWRQLAAAGFQTVCFATLPPEVVVQQRGNTLPEDLLAVYAGGRKLGRQYAGIVPAFELVGEPDLGYCTDLPDRVAAFQKAWYLGLKAGGKQAGAKSPMVLMGALGMPPGPWLERASANGLLDYTDAYSFHFYGHAKDLTSVIEAHRGFLAKQGPAAKGMPLWITEAGLAAVDEKDFLNPERRQLQADFTLATAKQALLTSDVAMFMPFILVHGGDPYALTLSAANTLPAWDAYAKFTRENPWPQRPLARKPQEAIPVVLQWLPDNQTCVPHKVSGTYRFRANQPLRGELRIYNFGSTAVQGWIEAGDLKNAVVRNCGTNPFRQPVSVPPMEMKTIPLEFTASAGGYFREFWKAAFVDEAGRRSAVSFGLEAWAELGDFTEEPLPLRPLAGGIVRFPQVAGYKPGGQAGVWSMMNGLRAANEKPEPGTRKPDECRFWMEQRHTDPLAPTMAVAEINGLPGQGFIRMQLDKPMTKARKVLVVLVDDRGQRYTIWENFGADYYGSRSDIWLNLEDFHADFWGPCSADYRFRPERIREVHLRFYLNDPGDAVQVGLSVLKSKEP